MRRVAFPIGPDTLGEEVENLYEALLLLVSKGTMATEGQGTSKLTILLLEERGKVYRQMARETVRRFQKVSGLATTGAVDERTAGALNDALAALGAIPPVAPPLVPPPSSTVPLPGLPPGSPILLAVQLYFEDGAPAADIRVRARSQGFGGLESALGGVATTDAAGSCQIDGAAPGKAQIVILQALQPGAGAEVWKPLMRPRLVATFPEILRLAVPSAWRGARASEYARLVADLDAAEAPIASLREASETGDRRDLTALHTATGWDARLLALAAQASRLAADLELELEPIYGLLRSGVAATAEAVLGLETEAAKAALQAARAGNIIDTKDEKISAFVAAQQLGARRAALSSRPPSQVSSAADLFAHARLSEDDRTKWLTVAGTDWKDAEELWQRATAAKVSEVGIARLQAHSSLATLTYSNALLSQELLGSISKPADLPELVSKGYYRPEAWTGLLDRVKDAEKVKLEDLLPPGVPGDTVEARAQLYAEDMARQVRRAYPTRVVAERVFSGELPVVAGAAAKGVRDVLVKADSEGYRLGSTPLGAFLKKHDKSLFPTGTSAETRRAQTKALRHLHRLYQITPDDTSMTALAAAGVSSARDVAAYPREQFVADFAAKLGKNDDVGARVAELVHRKAVQVDTTTRAVTVLMQQAQATPSALVLAPSAEARANAQQATLDLADRAPSLRSLLGSQDACDCDHCRSVLSPAAYFVDLLRFIDPEAGKQASEVGVTPYEVLKRRRPDLEKLELTCDNTNVALPYIDLCNRHFEEIIRAGLTPVTTANNAGVLSSADLVAEPEYVLTEVYDQLCKETFPIGAPFDLWTATARAYLEPFQTSFGELLQLFASEETLFALPGGAAGAGAGKPPDVATAFAEGLGIGRREYRLLVGAGSAPYQWHDLYGLAAGASTDAVGRNVLTLTRALGISVKELTDLLLTRYVNPQLGGLLLLQKQGITAEQVYRSLGVAGYPALTADDQAALDARLGTIVMPDGTTAKAWLKARTEAGDLDRVALISRPADGCDPEQMQVIHAGKREPASAPVLLRLNVLVRLWRRLGWTLDELDEALHVFLPKPATDEMKDVGPALRSALVGLAHLESLASRGRLGKSAKLQLLSLWSDLHTHGKQPLYAQLLLASSEDRETFDSASGAYMQNSTLKLADRLPAVQGATGASAADVGLILADAYALGNPAVPAEPAPPRFAEVAISLPILSLIYRYTLLAKMLKLSLADFVHLRRLSGLDPFAKPLPGGLSRSEDDFAGEKTVKLVVAAEALKAGGLTVADLRYLLLDDVEPGALERRQPAARLTALRAVSQALRRAAEEHTLPARDEEVTSELLQKRLALLYPPEVLTPLLGMLDGSIRYVAWVDAAQPLVSAAALASVPNLASSFDSIRMRQLLTATGVLTKAQLDQVKDLFANNAPGLAAIQPLLDDLSRQPRAFFAQMLAGEQPFVGVGAHPPTVELAFETLFADNTDAAARRRTVAAQLLPLSRRIAEVHALVAALAAFLGKDPAVIEALVYDAALALEAGSPPQPLVSSLQQKVVPGVLAEYFEKVNLVTPLSAVVVAAPDPHDAPKEAASARYSTVLAVAESGAYRFELPRGEAGKVSMRLMNLGSSSEPVAAAGNVADGLVYELQKDTQYEFVAEVRNLSGLEGGFGIRAERDSTVRGFTNLECWPPEAVSTVTRTLARIDRLVLLMESLELDVLEIRLFLTSAGDSAGGTLADLPVGPVKEPTSTTHSLFEHLVTLASYRRVRNTVSATPQAMVALLRAACRTFPSSESDEQVRQACIDGMVNALIAATGEPEAQLRAALAALRYHSVADDTAVEVTATGGAKKARLVGLDRVTGIARLFGLLAIARRLGTAPTALAAWTSSPPSAVTAAEVRGAVRSRYSSEDWRRAVQPIADSLRRLRRDALTEHLMWKKGYIQKEQLYEELLIDPGMEPVVLTSRLRLAISSVQLFINRCLMNLEEDVAPTKIDARKWEWMRRYRVWEASRKILLFAANWADPALYAEASPLYKSMLGSLLESDVDEDSIEANFFGYLQGLDQIARLQMVAMFCEEAGTVDTDDDVLHVVGRTFTTPHKYFYRSYQHHAWGPWEPVGADIDGDHMVAVWWRERLNLLWVTVVEKSRNPKSHSTTKFSDLESAAVDNVAVRAVKDLELRLNWCERVRGEWLPRQSSGKTEVLTFEDTGDYEPNRLFVMVRKEREGKQEAGIRIYATYHNADRTEHGTFWVRSRQAPVSVDHNVVAPGPFPYDEFTPGGHTRWTTTKQALALTHAALAPDDDGKETYEVFAGRSAPAALLPASYEDGPVPDARPIEWPFFYEDRDNTLFGRPRVVEEVFTEPIYLDLRDQLDRYRREHLPPRPLSPLVPWQPRDPGPLDTDALHGLIGGQDWLGNPRTVLKVGDRFVGAGGSFSDEELRRGFDAGRLGQELLRDGELAAAEIGRIAVEKPGLPVSLIDLNSGREVFGSAVSVLIDRVLVRTSIP